MKKLPRQRKIVFFIFAISLFTANTVFAETKTGNITAQQQASGSIGETKMANLNFFENSAVKITDSYYVNATNLQVKNMLSLDADRFLAGFRENACFAYNSNAEPNKKMSNAEIRKFMKDKLRYGGWENTLIGGHTFGHYLSGIAQAIANPTVNEEYRKPLQERLDYLIDSLAECQEKTSGTIYEGYLFSATLPTNEFKNKIDLQFDNIENGKGEIFTQAWVPWYTMHKILQGLLDVYTLTGNEKALAIAENLGGWIYNRVSKWDIVLKNKVLSVEYGGMNDVLYQLYIVSNSENRDNFLEAAHKFDEEVLFARVRKGGANVLNNRHANTTIPKFIGALRRYEATGEEDYLNFAKAFWTMVTQKHTYITGGNSENEHFGADNVLAAERTHVNNETCNTYNMLKLTRSLFAITGEKKYADYYETTFINAIMASQNPLTGLTMYFQPMATGYQKVFCKLDSDFWCCTGTGYENFTKLQDSIYFAATNNSQGDTNNSNNASKPSVQSGNQPNISSIIVNQYLASELKTAFFTLTQTGDLATGNEMTFKITKQSNCPEFDLLLRIPDWVAGDVALTIVSTADPNASNGNLPTEITGGYIKITSDTLNKNPEFTITLPMKTVAFGLQDNKNTIAFKYGPYVLSAKLGTAKQATASHGVWVTVPKTKAVENDNIKITAEKSVETFMEKINDYLVPSTDENGLRIFTLNGTDKTLVFSPHYQQYKESYGIYWNYSVK